MRLEISIPADRINSCTVYIQTRRMSLLIRRCKFDSYWRYSKLVNRIESQEHTLTNQIWISRNFCNIHAKPNVLDKTKRFLDYLANEYKNKSWKNNNFFDFIDFNASDSLLSKRVQLMENIQNLHDLGQQDIELKKLAEEEKALYKEQLNELDERLLNVVLTNMYKDFYNSIIVEITAGVGGQEAMLFVKDLYDMYMGYAKYLGLDHEVIDIDINDNKGIRHVSIMISGDQVDKFQYEGGVHRVQRVPATERLGRIHTSTASVAILPVPSEIQIAINEKDLSSLILYSLSLHP